MGRRHDAARAARKWLLPLSLSAEDQCTHREAGIALAEVIIDNGVLPALSPQHGIDALPSAVDLVGLSRDELILLSRTYTGPVCQEAASSLVLCHLAGSFARVDDLQAVAALLRLSALASADLEITRDVWRYVFAQQHPQGYFGLMAAELTLLSRRADSVAPRLAMTVEVLWALASGDRLDTALGW